MTVTSNIHVGLSVWQASHAYSSLGVRVSNGGNAYQVIATGTSASSGGPSGTGADITDNTVQWKYLSAINYTTISAWISSIPTTLTQPIIGQLWNDAPITTTVGTQFFNLTGHTTSATNTITLTCAPGESIRDSLATQTNPLAFNASLGVNFQYPSGVGVVDYITVEDNNVTIKGLQFQDTYAAGSQSAIMQINTPATNTTVTDCLFDGYGQGGGANLLGGNSANTFTISNCVFIDRELAVTDGDTFDNYGCVNTHFVNCTFIATVGGIGGNAIQMPSSSGISGTQCTNCIFIGYTAPFTNSSGSNVTLNNCITNVSSFGTGVSLGTGNLTSQTTASIFVNSASDWRLKSGSPAINVGSTDTTDLPTADDIAGTHRPQGTAWDIGAWEMVAVSNNASAIVSFVMLATSASAFLSSKLPVNIAADPSVFNFTSTAQTTGSVSLSWNYQSVINLSTEPVLVSFTAFTATAVDSADIALTWSTTLLPYLILVDGIASFSFNGKPTFMTMRSSASILQNNIATSTTTIDKLTAIGICGSVNYIQTAGPQPIIAENTQNLAVDTSLQLLATDAQSLTFYTLTASATLTRGNISVAKSTIINIKSVVSIVSAAVATTVASINVSCISHSIQQDQISAAVSLLVLTAVVNAPQTIPTTASATIEAVTTFATLSNPIGATARNTIEIISSVVNVAAIGSCVGTSLIEPMSVVATAVPLQNFTAVNNIDLQILGRATQFDQWNALAALESLSGAGQLTQFITTTAISSFEAISAAIVESTMTASIRVSLFPISAVVSAAKFTPASIAATILPLSVATSLLPLIKSESSLLLLADLTRLQLLADVSKLNLAQEDLSSAIISSFMTLNAASLTFQDLTVSSALTIFSLSSATSTIETTFATGASNIDLTCSATIGVSVTGQTSLMVFTVGKPLTPSLLADPFSIPLLIDPLVREIGIYLDVALPQVTQEDLTTAILSVLSLSVLSTALWSNISVGVLTIAPLTAIGQTIESTAATAISSIEVLTPNIQVVGTQNTIGSASFEVLTAAVVTGQAYQASAAATLEQLSATATSFNGNVAQAAVTIEPLSVVATAVFALGAINYINFSATATAYSSTNATATDSIEVLTCATIVAQQDLASSTDTIPLVAVAIVSQQNPASASSTMFGVACSGAIVQNGSQITSNVTIEVVFVSSTATQAGQATTVSSLELITSSQAHLWATPTGFVEGEQVVWWSD